MNNIADKTTFWIFLGQTSIVIPKLQRDYAQGRKGKESIRENFLSSIKNALDSDNKQLKLDFVYGTGDNGGNFTPLDGQQRLTTLWLLHWYLAFRIGALNDEAVKERLLRFTYETRVSSRQFCEKLVNRGDKISLKEDESISDAIIRQSWMFKAWRQDPTIQSMLRMLRGEDNNKLDGIEEVFSGCSPDLLKTYWDKLKMSAEECPIVFYSLDIENIGQSDDLYVKMNGRGKPLNDFENFKADLIKYCEDNNWEEFTNIENGLATLIDTEWINLFWQYRSNIPTDTLLFRFINRFFLTQWMANSSGIEDAAKKNPELKNVFEFLYSYIEDKDQEKPYNEIGFKAYRFLFEQINARETLNLLVTYLNNICNNKCLMDTVNNPYDSSKFKILYTEGSNKNKPNFYPITQQQLIAFWAVGKFMTSTSDVTTEAISKWMRVIWNICDYNNEFRDKTAVNTTIYILNSIFSSPDKFNEKLSSLDIANIKPLWSGQRLTILGEHLLEEQVKLKKINEGEYNGSLEQFTGRTWEYVITQAEKLHFDFSGDNFIVSGNLRCLLRDEKGEYTWDNFDNKFTHLSHYIKERLDTIAYRNYLRTAWSHEYTNHIAGTFWFGCTGSTLSSHLKFWRDILSSTEEHIIRLVHYWLNSTPLSDSSLKKEAKTHYALDYVKYMMVGSSLIKDSYDKDGIYLTFSTKSSHWVLFHHQTRLSSYVVFNHSRNTELINTEGITIKNAETCLLNCGMLNGRNIEFTYLDHSFIWTANNFLYLTKDKDLDDKHVEYQSEVDLKEQLNQIITSDSKI